MNATRFFSNRFRLSALRTSAALGACCLAVACGQASGGADEGASGDAPGAKLGRGDAPKLLGGPGDAPGIVAVNDCNTEAGYEVTTHYSGNPGPGLIVVGTYETHGNARVLDTRFEPHDLVLSAYEATHWQVDVAPASGLLRVFVAGVEEQTVVVSGKGDVGVTDLNADRPSPLPYAYQWPDAEGGSDTQGLVEALREITQRPLVGFGGCYESSDFLIKSGAPPVDPPDPPAVTVSYARDCSSGEVLFFSTELSCEASIAKCEAFAELLPAQSFACTCLEASVDTLPGPIFVHEATPGACSSGFVTPQVCDGEGDVGEYVGSYCESGGPFIESTGTCAEAYENCQLNAGLNPDISVTCAWNGKTIYTSEATPGACSP